MPFGYAGRNPARFDPKRTSRRIRQGAPIVIMSGYNKLETSQRFLGKGTLGFLQKPYEISALRTIVRAIFERDG